MNYGLGLSNIPIVKRLFCYAALLSPPFLKKLLYRLIGYKIAKGVRFGWFCGIFASEVEIGKNSNISDFTLIFAGKLRMGMHSIISIGCWLYGKGSITLGDFTYIGPRCIINNYEDFEMKANSGLGPQTSIYTHGVWLPYSEGNPRKFGDVIIGKSVWVPARVLILPGVKIGDGSIIGAGAVVHKDVGENRFVGGVPAVDISSTDKLIKKLNAKERYGRIDEMIDAFCTENEFIKINDNWKKNNSRVIIKPQSNVKIGTNDIVILTAKHKLQLNSSWFDFNSRKCSIKSKTAFHLYHYLVSYYGEYFEIV